MIRPYLHHLTCNLGAMVVIMGLGMASALGETSPRESAPTTPTETAPVAASTTSPVTAAEPTPPSPGVHYETFPDLTDVPLDHWAYPAVQELLQTLGCLSGYPDDTYRGDQLLSRYEFSAALSACMDNLIQLIPPSTSTEDIQQELDALTQSLEELRGEVGELEGEEKSQVGN